MKPRELENNTKIRKLEIFLALVALAFYVLCFASAAALADDSRKVAATAPLAGLRPEKRNGDYLDGLAKTPSSAKTLNAAIFDKSIADEMKAKYQFNSDYEIREAYQLNDQGDYLRYQQANKDLAEWTVKKLLQYHFEHTLKNNIERSAKQTANDKGSSKESQAIAKAAVTLSKVHKALQNSAFNFGEAKTRVKYDFPSGLVKVGMESPLVDASMDYRMSRPAEKTVGTVTEPEKLSLGMSKKLAVVGASTGARYGLISKTVDYGVNKEIVGPLSAQVNQAHNLRDRAKDETLFRLNLGTSF